MKVELKETQHKTFQPCKLIIEIENMAELKAIWCICNKSLLSIKAEMKREFDEDESEKIPSGFTDKLWQIVDNHIRNYSN